MRLRDTAPTWLWWLPAAAWMLMIFVLSAQSDFGFVPDAWQIDPVSLAAHFMEYAVLAALLWLAAHHTPALARHAWWVALAIALLYAASDEWHQTFVPGRVADARDWLADAAGAALGCWLAVRWYRRRVRRSDRREDGSGIAGR